MSRLVSFIVLAAVVVVVGLLSFQVLAQFLLPLFLAVVLSVMVRPVTRAISARIGGRVRIAALLTTILCVTVVLLPLAAILFLAGAESVTLIRQFDPQAIEPKLDRLRNRLNLDLPPAAVYERMIAIGEDIDELSRAATEDRPADSTMVADMRKALDQLPAELERYAATKQPGTDETMAERVDLPELKALILELNQQLAAFEAAHDYDTRQMAVERIREAYGGLKWQLVGNSFMHWLKVQANPDQTQLDNFRERLKSWLEPLAWSTTHFVGSFLLNLIVGIAIMLLALYYFLADGPGMVQAVMHLSPLDESYERQMVEQFDKISRAVVMATLLSAVVQGLLAGIGYLAAGLHSAFLLTVLTMLLAMIPFVGAASVWGGCSLWLFLYEERPLAAALLALYGLLIVSMADNVIKPLVLHGQSHLHPLLALLSVLGGVQALGPIGIFVGPMVVAFLQAVLIMLQSEISALSTEAASAKRKKGK